MPLDTTVAGVASDSYISVSEADALAARSLGRNGAKWSDATLTQRENALRQAVVDIETYLGSVGPRYSAAQARSFPRAVDHTGTPPAPYIPQEVKQAQYEQAVYRLVNATLLEEADARDARGLISFSDGDGGGTIALDRRLRWFSAAAKAQLDALTSRTPIRARVVSVPMVRA